MKAVGYSMPAEEKKEPPAVTSSRTLILSGYTQVLYTTQDKGFDGFTLRKARLNLAGELLKNVRYRMQVDVVKSPILLDAAVEFAFLEAATLRIGQFKVPFSQESLTSSSDIDMINRSQPVSRLSPGQDIGSSGRDTGAMVFGKASIIEYTLGAFNGAGINKADTNEEKDLAGRIVIRPTPFLAVGASVYDGMYSASANTEPVKRDRAGLELAVLYSAFSLKGEFIQASDGETIKQGWYLQAGYFFIPQKLQGLIKADSYDKDTKTALDRSDLWTMGLNWFLSEKTKFQVNFELYKDESGKTTNSVFLAHFQAAF
jgi:phosphate-selective porin